MTVSTVLRPACNFSTKLEADPSSYVGARIAKCFLEKRYFGTVKSFSHRDDNRLGNHLWLIRYDDGDEEDFEEAEMAYHIQQYKQHRSDYRNREIVPNSSTTKKTPAVPKTTLPPDKRTAKQKNSLPSVADKTPPKSTPKTKTVFQLSTPRGATTLASSPTSEDSFYDSIKRVRRKRTQPYSPSQVAEKQRKDKKTSSNPTTKKQKVGTAANPKKPAKTTKDAVETTSKKTNNDKIMENVVGKRIVKFFGDEPYFGTVVEHSLPHENQENMHLFLIRYDDDDQEDFDRGMLEEGRKLYTTRFKESDPKR